MHARTQTILLCEDDELVGPMYEDFLTMDGYNVVRVKNGAEVIPAIREHCPALVLLDMIMPNKMGFEVLQDLVKEENERCKHVPVVMLSNLHQEEVVASAKRLGVAEYIVKSDITPKELGERIRQYIPEHMHA